MKIKYANLHSYVATTPTQFASINLICKFHPKSKALKPKIATEVVQAYVDNMYAKCCGSTWILSENGTEFTNSLYQNVAK